MTNTAQPTRVTPDALLLAAEWVEEYDGFLNGEGDAGELRAVAEFLRAEAERRTLEKAARAVARAAAEERGIPVTPALLTAARGIVRKQRAARGQA